MAVVQSISNDDECLNWGAMIQKSRLLSDGISFRTLGKNRMKIRAFVGLAALLPTVSFATGFDVFAHISEIQPSYVPNNLVFAIDQAAGVCHAGPWLFFNGNAGSNNLPENNKAVYAEATTALVTGNLVEVSGDDNGCLVTTVHLLNPP